MDSLEKELTQCDIPLKPGEFLADAGRRRSSFASLFTMLITRNIYTAMVVLGIASVIHIPILKIKRTHARRTSS